MPQGKEIAAGARRVAFAVQGCKVNQYEIQALEEEFLARGWRVVPIGEAADLVVINSCTVTEGSDRDLRKLVARAGRAGATGRILVTGCKAQVDADTCRDLAGVGYVVDNLHKMEIPALADSLALVSLTSGPASEIGVDRFPEAVEDLPISRLGGRGRPILKVQDGCPLNCSYCIVPEARGGSRGRRVAEIIAMAHDLEERGFGELVLSGIQLGFYRDPDDRADNLAALLEQLLESTSTIRFRLGSLLPRHVTPELLALFKSEPVRLCDHLHIALQSGDDDILAAMKRPYTRSYFRDLLLRIGNELGDPCLGTDIITGFPGESGEIFERSLTFIAELPLACGHVFPFSPRPGTAAATMRDDTPRAEKMRRGKRVREILAAKQAAYRRRQVGRSLQAIVEKDLGDGRFTGTTGNYQRVVFEAPAAVSGSLLDLEVTGLYPDDDTSLSARCVD
ncbi:MAG: MiaB/RimO family radical SAM methylthiotransferase [bacterium]|nr:MiaB/RimO family radical SAM methylthiotransferase [bacterium]